MSAIIPVTQRERCMGDVRYGGRLDSSRAGRLSIQFRRKPDVAGSAESRRTWVNVSIARGALTAGSIRAAPVLERGSRSNARPRHTKTHRGQHLTKRKPVVAHAAFSFTKPVARIPSGLPRLPLRAVAKFVPTNMAEEPSKVQEKSPQNLGISFVSAVAEAAFRLRRIAEPYPPGDRVKSAILRAAKRAGLSTRRAEHIWYGEAKLVRAEEMDAIRMADDARQAKEDSVREQAKSLGSLFAGIVAHLRETDPDFHSESIAALVDAARAMGAVDRSVDQAEDRG